jgi:hypothetical protein
MIAACDSDVPRRASERGVFGINGLRSRPAEAGTAHGPRRGKVMPALAKIPASLHAPGQHYHGRTVGWEQFEDIFSLGRIMSAPFADKFPTWPA